MNRSEFEKEPCGPHVCKARGPAQLGYQGAEGIWMDHQPEEGRLQQGVQSEHFQLVGPHLETAWRAEVSSVAASRVKARSSRIVTLRCDWPWGARRPVAKPRKGHKFRRRAFAPISEPGWGWSFPRRGPGRAPVNSTLRKVDLTSKGDHWPIGRLRLAPWAYRSRPVMPASWLCPGHSVLALAGADPRRLVSGSHPSGSPTPCCLHSNRECDQ